MHNDEWTRRSFLRLSAATMAAAATAALPATPAAARPRRKQLPVGLELYSVRDDLAKDLMGTVSAVAKMDYKIVEFYAPYFQWTTDYAKQVRNLLDELKIECRSTHNDRGNLSGDRLKHAIELNQIIGSTTIVMASGGGIDRQEECKKVADILSAAAETLKPLGMRAGYHNHRLEFTPKDGFIAMPFLAANTPPDVTLQFDVGTSVEAGYDPVAWIQANPGRIRSLHLKDWGRGPDRGYRVLFGEGDVLWGPLLDAAEKTGGAEYVLIEQEGSQFPELEGVKMCLANYRKMRG